MSKTSQILTTDDTFLALNVLTKLMQALNAPKLKVESQPQSKPTLEEIHQPYIDRLIREIVEYGKACRSPIKEQEVTFYQVKSYQNYGQWELARHGEKYGFSIGEQPCLRIEQVENRLLRISRLRLKRFIDVEKEFKNEVCRSIGLTEGELCIQQYILARHFNVEFKYNYFTMSKALDMDREHMKAATEVIFEIEKRHGIYDTDREYGKKVEEAVRRVVKPRSNDLSSGNKKITEYTDNEWYMWFEKMIGEYEKLCCTDKETAIKLMFDTFKWQTGFVDSGNFTIDIHEILSKSNNKGTLKEQFSLCIANSFLKMW